MVYIFLDKNTVKILGFTKTILGQYNTSFFKKTHTVSLFEDGKPSENDIIASVIKEGLTQATPNPITDTEVSLILPHELFFHTRYTIPQDISQSALLPFIKDKLNSESNFQLNECFYDILISNSNNESIVNVYALNKSIYSIYAAIFKLLGLEIKNIVPDTVCYFKLFDKTFRKEKRELVLYISYEEESFGYLFDSFGLLENQKYYLKNPIEQSLKKQSEEIVKIHTKIDRIILSGEKSDTVRQDLFTKNSGIWTNPLGKIIQTFYQDYIKLLIPQEKSPFSMTDFDACLGAFVFEYEKTTFSLLSDNKNSTQATLSKKRLSLPKLPIKMLIIFLLTLSITLGIVYVGLTKPFSVKLPTLTSPTKTPTPTKMPKPTKTPTPTINKEKIKIKILNGSGIKGKAGEVADVIKAANYVDVVTANATDESGNDKFDYQKTIIQVAKTNTALFNDLVKILDPLVSISKQDLLPDDENADVIIIIGSDIQSPNKITPSE